MVSEIVPRSGTGEQRAAVGVAAEECLHGNHE